ncbi:hypothetical protein J4450_03890 [Candidatus Micrarchaeota archaeon]|nr:hypothetical protein [Candidatus Micrarchaeota archaeon]
MELVSRIARKAEGHKIYLRARWQLGKIKSEPVMLGITHSDEMLPHVKRILKFLKDRGRTRLGIELPENYIEESLKIRFFSQITEYAQKLGYSIIPLVVALHNDEFNTRREGSGNALDMLSINDWDSNKASLHVRHELKAVLARIAILVQVKVSGIETIRYMPPEITAGIFTEEIARDLSSVSARDITLAEARLMRWCSSLQYAIYLIENKSVDEIKEIFRSANEELDAYMVATIKRELPNLVVIGDGHARAINHQIGYAHVQMSISNLTWNM